MDPAWLFLVVLAALHVIEGFLWVRREAIAFTAGWSAYRWFRAGGPLGTPREVLLPLSPLPPFAEMFIVEPWPLTMATSGVWLGPCQRLSEPRAPAPDVGAWTWQEAARVRVEGRRIEGPRGLSVKASSADFARHIVETLHAAAALSNKKRARVLAEVVAEAYDVDATTARLRFFRRTTWRLRVYGNLLFVALFLGAYGLFFVQGVIFYWPYLAGGLGGLMLLILVETWVAHRRLYGSLRADRWMTLMLMLVSPPAGARARAWLARDALVRFDPVAVGFAIASEPERRRLAAAAWRDLAHPLGPEDPDAAAALAEARGVRREALRRLVAQFDDDVAAFDVQPDAGDPAFEGYCPRCLEVYRDAEGECSDCPGVTRRRLARAAVAA